jgi:hypothetical protein
MPQYNYIPIAQVRAVAKINLDIEDTTAHDKILDFFIQDGMKEIRSIESRKLKAITLQVEDNKGELPCDFILFVGAQSEGWNYGLINQSYLQHAGVELGAPYADFMNAVHIENGIIDFGQANNAQSVKLLYEGGNVDKNGNLLIPSIFENALAWYAAYRFASKKRYPEAQEYRRNWLIARSDVRGDVWVDTFKENKMEIMSIINAWIVQKGNYQLPFAKL